MFIQVKYGDMAVLEVHPIFSERLETFRRNYDSRSLKIVHHVVVTSRLSGLLIAATPSHLKEQFVLHSFRKKETHSQLRSEILNSGPG